MSEPHQHNRLLDEHWLCTIGDTALCTLIASKLTYADYDNNAAWSPKCYRIWQPNCKPHEKNGTASSGKMDAYRSICNATISRHHNANSSSKNVKNRGFMRYLDTVYTEQLRKQRQNYVMVSFKTRATSVTVATYIFSHGAEVRPPFFQTPPQTKLTEQKTSTRYTNE